MKPLKLCQMSEKLDLIIIGAGAAGLACGIEAKRRGLAFHIIERGSVVNSIYRFPVNMEFLYLRRSSGDWSSSPDIANSEAASS